LVKKNKEDVMAKLVSTIFGFTLGFIIQIGVMIYGWGLEPKSWW